MHTLKLHRPAVKRPTPIRIPTKEQFYAQQQRRALFIRQLEEAEGGKDGR
jgi:hypothetical protein